MLPLVFEIISVAFKIKLHENIIGQFFWEISGAFSRIGINASSTSVPSA